MRFNVGANLNEFKHSFNTTIVLFDLIQLLLYYLCKGADCHGRTYLHS